MSEAAAPPPPAPPADVPDGWQGILDPGERILWQARPDARLVWRARDLPLIGFGIVFAGFALFWMIMAASAGGFMWMFGLIHFSVGVGLVLTPTVFSAYRRARTWYTLTDKRAFIASELPIRGRKLDSYPIARDTVLTLEDGTPGDVWFASTYRRTKNGSREVKIGFERIDDPRAVYALMRRIQRGEA
ncbi:aspartate carbamoyltransferase catalytic subunit [Anianabacter salinae]|uniref:aspartate carbamoyltransferase catalytic subunit n=1 Tax=Anianabacter salinae TaxID=2851023 RepID=UPI00225E2F09|nr:aspartate carbamoyltransferase catalytic subunit [Anianabacter salinae]MBV0910839.1 aspartate carbamoyltransferase catalytic subunit [Anianabacter salinae]